MSIAALTEISLDVKRCFCYSTKETPRRRITVKSTLKERDQLTNRAGVRVGEAVLRPFPPLSLLYSRILDIHIFKDYCT